MFAGVESPVKQTVGNTFVRCRLTDCGRGSHTMDTKHSWMQGAEAETPPHHEWTPREPACAVTAGVVPLLPAGLLRLPGGAGGAEDRAEFACGSWV